MGAGRAHTGQPRPDHRVPSHTWPVFSSTGRTGPRPPWGRKDRVPIRPGTNETDLEEALHSGGTDKRARGLGGTCVQTAVPEPCLRGAARSGCWGQRRELHLPN